MAIVITKIQYPISKQAPSPKHPNSKRVFDLEKRTLIFSINIIRLCKSLSSTPINRELIAQVIRSGGSIGANYREASDTGSKKDFVHRIRIALREAKETEYWLQLIEEAHPELDSQLEVLLKEVAELRKILAAIMIKAA